MIYLGPINDTQKVETLFKEKNIPLSEGANCVAAVCGEETLGYCLYDLNSERMLIYYLEPLNDISLADGILRSTLHVAAEHSIMNAYYADTVPEEFLEKIGFIKEREEKLLNIDKLFQSCCNCGK